MATAATGTVATGKPQNVTVKVYDVLGRRVARLHDGRIRPGKSVRLRLKGGDLSSGSYSIRAREGRRTKTTRITVVR